MGGDGTPSERIAAELRRRIAAGELRPGERVPSTRTITREWGVAMATASKVLALLAQEGLVRAVPGVGTVVAEREQAPPPAAAPRRARVGERELNRERIVEAALRVADAEGLAALSMRRVATTLGTATMSLYRHVPSKEELLRLMVDAAFREEPLPEPAPGQDWRAELAEVARTQWRIGRRHLWLPGLMSFTRPMPAVAAAAHTERAMAVLAGTGLGLHDAVRVAVSLSAYTCGLAVNFETEAQAEQDSGMSADEWMDDQERFHQLTELSDPGSFPNFAALRGGPDLDLSLETLFEFGLARMLDGVAALIERRAG